MQTHRQQQSTGQSHLHAAKQTQSGVEGLNGVGLNKSLSSPVPFIFLYSLPGANKIRTTAKLSRETKSKI